MKRILTITQIQLQNHIKSLAEKEPVMSFQRCAVLFVLLSAISLGCNREQSTVSGPGGTGDSDTPSAGPVPVFSLAWSEYPSWSVFGVAHEMGLLDAAEGAMGEIEKKHGVDVVLKEAGYDGCLNLFTTNNCDAVCMTNMDALIVSPNRDGVALLPTSTSNGADACIVVDINSIDELKPHKIFGLEATVSQYCFVRCIEESAKQDQKDWKPEEFQFTNQDPAVAAANMTQKQATHKAIMVWNPFVLQTLNDRPDAKVLFDSSMIPGEIVDMVVVGRDVLERSGSENFVHAILETFYRMNEELAKPDTGDKALVALGEKFSKLGLEDMKKVVQQTEFYKTPEDGISLLESDEFRTTMETVANFCTTQGLVSDPQYGFESAAGQKLLFDASYIKSWKDAQP
jgi:NitT/TauT family transport system substrate-binding protein